MALRGALLERLLFDAVKECGALVVDVLHFAVVGVVMVRGQCTILYLLLLILLLQWLLPLFVVFVLTSASECGRLVR